MSPPWCSLSFFSHSLLLLLLPISFFTLRTAGSSPPPPSSAHSSPIQTLSQGTVLGLASRKDRTLSPHPLLPLVAVPSEDAARFSILTSPTHSHAFDGTSLVLEMASSLILCLWPCSSSGACLQAQDHSPITFRTSCSRWGKSARATEMNRAAKKKRRRMRERERVVSVLSD